MTNCHIMIMTTFFIATKKYLIQHKTLIVHCQCVLSLDLVFDLFQKQKNLKATDKFEHNNSSDCQEFVNLTLTQNSVWVSS